MSILVSKDWSISALQEGNKESSYIWFDFSVMKQPIAPCQKRSTVGILLGFTWLLPVNKEIRSNISFIKHEFLWVRSIKNDNRFLLLHTEYFWNIFFLPTIKKTKITILCDFQTGILVLLCNKIVFCRAYKCWTELMRKKLNKITVTSLTSEMKDVPVRSRGVFNVQITIL